MNSQWRDEQIYAYVDGALDAQTAVQLEADSRGDAALAARIAKQRELRALLQAGFDSVLDEPVPQRLRDALAGPGRGAAVTPIGAARDQSSRRRPWSVREWSAIAATLVLGVLVGQLAFRGTGSGLPIETQQGRLVASGALDAALSTQLGGAPADGAATRIGLSFRAASGEYCRTFTLQTGVGGVACRRAGRWGLEVLEGGSERQAAPGDFRQASSALSPAVVGAINALGAGEPLTVEEEKQRLGSGWDSAEPQR